MKGGHGGHNGLRSIQQHFGGTQDFPRLKIGGQDREQAGAAAPPLVVSVVSRVEAHC